MKRSFSMERLTEAKLKQISQDKNARVMQWEWERHTVWVVEEVEKAIKAARRWVYGKAEEGDEALLAAFSEHHKKLHKYLVSAQCAEFEARAETVRRFLDTRERQRSGVITEAEACAEVSTEAMRSLRS